MWIDLPLATEEQKELERIADKRWQEPGQLIRTVVREEIESEQRKERQEQEQSGG
jgi:metal-responsive CopG/Arc/MetJ family transcriptional regulator